MYDIIIVGAGPAGLTAAIYGARAGKKVLIFEGSSFGGQITTSKEVENYPGIQMVSGFEFANTLVEQAKKFGVEIQQEKVKNVEDMQKYKLVHTGQSSYKAKTVILATGVERRLLGVPGEKKFMGTGVSYCATCDGMFFRGRTVAVVGGGNTALEDALYLAEICKKVIVIHRRDEFRGELHLAGLLEKCQNVEFYYNTRVVEILGEDVLERICLEDTKSGEFFEVAVDGLFVAIGQVPSNELFKNIVKTDRAGYIIADESTRTTCEGIFVAGDGRTKQVRQLATATADGAVAALAACEFIISAHE